MPIHASIQSLICALLVMLLTSCADEGGTQSQTVPQQVPEAMRPTLSFYRIPNCFLCQDIASTLAELEKDYKQAINFRTVDYHLPASQERIHKSQLGSHGVIISDPQGNKLWSLKAHVEGNDELLAAVKRLATPN